MGIQGQTSLRIDREQSWDLEDGGIWMTVHSGFKLAKIQTVELALTLFFLCVCARLCWGQQ